MDKKVLWYELFKLYHYGYLLPANNVKASKFSVSEKSLFVFKLSGNFMNDFALNLTLLSDASTERWRKK